MADSNNLGDTAPPKGLLQLLGYPRGIAQDHPPHDGRLPGPQTLAQSHVRLAVDSPDPSPLLICLPDTFGVDDA